MRELLATRMGSGDPADWEGDAWVIATVDNRIHLEQAYGSACTEIVWQAVHERARALCTLKKGCVNVRGNSFLMVFDASELAGNTCPIRQAAWEGELLGTVLSVLGEGAVSVGGKNIFAAISARMTTPEEIQNLGKPDLNEFGIEPKFDGDWCVQYRSDMVLVDKAFSLIERGGLFFQFEPVCGLYENAKVTYYEALLRSRGSDDFTPGKFIPAFERLGLVRYLDQWVVSQMLEKLAANSHIRLGCNISAQSAVVDGLWTSIFTRLQQRPDIASRLVIEITETAPLPNLGAVDMFVQGLQAYGCKVALDDIGTCYSTIEALVRLRPDIAKIDMKYLFAARESVEGRDCLKYLVLLARLYAMVVVVEGVEGERDLTVAIDSGATAGQGYWLRGVAEDFRGDGSISY